MKWIYALVLLGALLLENQTTGRYVAHPLPTLVVHPVSVDPELPGDTLCRTFDWDLYEEQLSDGGDDQIVWYCVRTDAARATGYRV